MKKKKILLFDGNNLLFRSFFAVKELKTSTGIPTNGIYGSLKSFRSTINEFKPSYAVVLWDNGKKTFRHEQDETYKSGRPPIHEDLRAQFSTVKKAFKVLGIPQIVAPDGIEADDLVGSIATKSDSIGLHTIIVSSDKDFFQLCTDTLNVYSFTVKNKNGTGIVNAKYVRETFGVEPPLLNDLKSLTGERCDSIAGIKGIGEKTALKLIKEHGSIHNILKILKNNQDFFQQNKLPSNAVKIIENAYSLAKIKTDVEVDVSGIIPVKKIKCDSDKLLEFFKEMEFNQFISEINSWSNLFNYSVKIS